jgi:phage recombination protein Bet
MAATYKLDPFAREIWAVKMPGKNASGSGVVIMVGRDGLLSIAERNPDYRGFRCEAYYENDSLKKLSQPVEQPDGTWTYVQHEFEINKDRGALLGAWAEVYRAGRPPVFFNAKLDEYSKDNNEYSPWRRMKTVMIEKVALATALRLTYRISGLYLADEMTNASLDRPDEAMKQTPVTAGLNLGDDPQVASWLQMLLDKLAQAKPDAYLPGKQRLLLAPLDHEGRVELGAKLQAELYETTGELVELPSDEAEEVEGEVVEESPSDS